MGSGKHEFRLVLANESRRTIKSVGGALLRRGYPVKISAEGEVVVEISPPVDAEMVLSDFLTALKRTKEMCQKIDSQEMDCAGAWS